jgi:putative tryptophan/tyrosine transport system substrate-binding protein
MKRRHVLTILGGVWLVWPLALRAQGPDRMRRIAVLIGLPEDDAEALRRLRTFKQALEELGWSEKRNVQIYHRGAGDLRGMQSRAAELVSLGPDVILAQTTPATAALRRVSASVPIVFVSVPDPIGSGFVESLSRPGRNTTGFTNFEASIGGKWLELVTELAPATKRVAMLYNPDTASGGAVGGVYLRSAEQAAHSLGVQFIVSAVGDAAEIDSAFVSLARDAGAAVIVMPNAFTAVHRELIVALAAKHRLPATYPFRYFVDIGGLVSYGVDQMDLFRRAAVYVDAILRGAKPSDLPVQAPTKFELVINLKTAKELGITIPPRLLALTDEVIE